MPRPNRRPASFGISAAAALAACSAEAPSSRFAPDVEFALPPGGVPDHGSDPAVVSLAADGVVVCAGALVASDVVVSAVACVAPTPCAWPVAADVARNRGRSLVVTTGGSIGAARARVRDVVLPPNDAPPSSLREGCGAMAALLLLDAPIDDVAPLVVRAAGAARGDHVRTAGLASEAGAMGWVVRDHVLVAGADAHALALDEGAFSPASGAAVVDPATASLVGVVTARLVRGDGGSADVAARVDSTAAAWIPAALAQLGGDRVAASAAKTKRGPIDMGGACSSALDCSAGVCVAQRGRRYCSRTCDPEDRCPSRWRCDAVAVGPAVCVEN